MSDEERKIFELIKRVAREVIPSGTQAYLYGSRARGDAHTDSDWDILILVDAPRVEVSMYDTLAYPFTFLGWEQGEVIIPIILSMDEWNHPSSLLFRLNVEKDAIPLV